MVTQEKREKINYSWYSVQGLGRMAQTPQAGTCDSVSRFRRSRFRRSHCSTVINYDSYFLMIILFLIVIYDLDSRITAEYSKCQTSFYSMQVSFRFHSLRCSETPVSPSICTKIRTWRFHRTEEVSNNFSETWPTSRWPSRSIWDKIPNTILQSWFVPIPSPERSLARP